MIRILGSARKLCSGLTRRDALHIGGLGLFGVGLSDFFRLQEAQAAASAAGSPVAGPFGQAKSCIFLLPYGSPPQHETFDPKPDAPAEIQGDLGTVASSLPGVRCGELMPRVAQVMDRLTVVRSMTHPYPVHCTAYVVSGIPNYSVPLELKPRDPRHWPYIGSIVDYVLQQRSPGEVPEIPRNMALPWKMNRHSGGTVFAGPWAAFLGPAYDPVLTDFEGTATEVVQKRDPSGKGMLDIRDPYAGITPESRFRLAGTELRGSLTLDRLNRRKSLLDQFDDARLRLDRNEETSSHDRYQQMAMSLLTSSRTKQALDLSGEPASLREQYGMNLFGQSCLAARRLVEAGSRFVTVFWDEYGTKPASDWDTHYNQTHRLKGWLMPGFDSGFSGLIRDLEQRGMLDETLVVWLSEHGRTPKFNSNAGRDHWSRAYSIAMAGGGAGRGLVVGETDEQAGDVVSTPVSPKDILATVFYLLGIDPATTVPDRLGRPHLIAGEGQLRTEVFSPV